MPGLFYRAMRTRALAQIRYVRPIPDAEPGSLVDRVYREMDRDFGLLAPPIALAAPAPGPLAAGWLMLREGMLADGPADRSTKEAVAAAVSLGNTCPYCVTMHTSVLRALGSGKDAGSLARDRIAKIGDPGLRAVSAWARTGAERDAAAAHPAPFPAAWAPQLVGVAVTFHYLNRMVNVFLPDAPLPPGVPVQALGPVTRVLSAVIRGAAGRVAAPASSVDLLPPAEPRPDLPWAAADPVLADVFARAGAAIDLAARDAVPDSVRTLLLDRLATWDGRPPGPSRAWLGPLAAAVPAADRAAARLALLTAFAAYQVDGELIELVRTGADGGRPADDAALVALVSWSAFAAAVRAGAWLRYDGQPPSAPVPAARARG